MVPEGVRHTAVPHFYLPEQGLPDAVRQQAIRSLAAQLEARRQYFMGYQANQYLSYQDDLGKFLDCQLNNIGDPFSPTAFGLNTKPVERQVLDYFARLWHAKTPHDPADGESYWGYVLSMGSTEGNLYGLWNARDYLQGRRVHSVKDANSGQQRFVELLGRRDPENPVSLSPVVFYSEDTHYSLIKIVRMLGLRTFYECGTTLYPGQCPLQSDWPTEVPSTGGPDGPGAVDLDALERLVDFFASRGHPIIVNFNLGTTFKGAYDDVENAGTRLLPVLERHGLLEQRIHYDTTGDDDALRAGYWFHVDGALGAAHLPFLERAHAAGRLIDSIPRFDFRLPYVHSISMSGHKTMGAPWPCGIFMTRTKLVMKPPSDPEYVLGADTTLSGSRNGLSALVLWDYLARYSLEEQVDKALVCEHLARYTLEQLQLLSVRRGLDLWAARSPLSLTVRFRRPSQRLIDKYSLSCEKVKGIDTPSRWYAHVFLMEHVTENLVQQLIADLETEAFPDAEEQQVPQPIATLSDGAQPLLEVPTAGRSFR